MANLLFHLGCLAFLLILALRDGRVWLTRKLGTWSECGLRAMLVVWIVGAVLILIQVVQLVGAGPA